MFYHINIGIPVIHNWFEYNKTKEEVLNEYVCPFIKKEVTLDGETLRNYSSFGNFKIFQTERPIDSDWPVKKSDFNSKGELLNEHEYQGAIKDFLNKINGNITQKIFQEALILLETGEYEKFRNAFLQDIKGKFCFFICPLNDKEIEHNYEYAIKPVVKQYQFSIQKADEISYSGQVTEKIIDAINRSRFLIADLTNTRPNCYYEVGYAHAIGKPVIITAKTGTERHFDIAGYEWNYWDDYRDLKEKMEKSVPAVLKELNLI
jgi:hypothetical protein